MSSSQFQVYLDMLQKKDIKIISCPDTKKNDINIYYLSPKGELRDRVVSVCGLITSDSVVSEVL